MQTAGSRKGDLAIVSLHPQPGTEFLASPACPFVEDYPRIGLVPGLSSDRSVLILAGTPTFGTQAAADYVSRGNSLEELLSRIPVSNSSRLRPFEAVIHVKVARVVSVETKWVALRARSRVRTSLSMIATRRVDSSAFQLNRFAAIIFYNSVFAVVSTRL